MSKAAMVQINTLFSRTVVEELDHFARLEPRSDELAQASRSEMVRLAVRNLIRAKRRAYARSQVRSSDAQLPVNAPL